MAKQQRYLAAVAKLAFLANEALRHGNKGGGDEMAPALVFTLTMRIREQLEIIEQHLEEVDA